MVAQRSRRRKTRRKAKGEAVSPNRNQLRRISESIDPESLHPWILALEQSRLPSPTNRHTLLGVSPLYRMICPRNCLGTSTAWASGMRQIFARSILLRSIAHKKRRNHRWNGFGASSKTALLQRTGDRPSPTRPASR